MTSTYRNEDGEPVWFSKPVPVRRWIDIFADWPTEVQAEKLAAVLRFGNSGRPKIWSADNLATRMGLPTDYVRILLAVLLADGRATPAKYAGRFQAAA